MSKIKQQHKDILEEGARDPMLLSSRDLQKEIDQQIERNNKEGAAFLRGVQFSILSLRCAGFDIPEMGKRV